MAQPTRSRFDYRVISEDIFYILFISLAINNKRTHTHTHTYTLTPLHIHTHTNTYTYTQNTPHNIAAVLV